MTPIAQNRISVPTSTQELSGLLARRDELRNQIAAANEQRGELANQVQRIGISEAEVRAGPLARLKQMDERIDRLSRELQSADDAIAEAKSKGIGSENPAEAQVYVSPPPTPGPFVWGDFPGVHEASWRERAIESLPVTAPITLATVVLVGAVIYWRLSRAMKNQINRLQATQTGALLQLQQSLDSVAVEIERVSENQRFVTKLVGEKTTKA